MSIFKVSSVALLLSYSDFISASWGFAIAIASCYVERLSFKFYLSSSNCCFNLFFSSSRFLSLISRSTNSWEILSLADVSSLILIFQLAFFSWIKGLMSRSMSYLPSLKRPVDDITMCTPAWYLLLLRSVELWVFWSLIVIRWELIWSAVFAISSFAPYILFSAFLIASSLTLTLFSASLIAPWSLNTSCLPLSNSARVIGCLRTNFADDSMFYLIFSFFSRYRRILSRSSAIRASFSLICYFLISIYEVTLVNSSWRRCFSCYNGTISGIVASLC